MSLYGDDRHIARWLLAGSYECRTFAENYRVHGRWKDALREMRLHVSRRELCREIMAEELARQGKAVKP